MLAFPVLSIADRMRLGLTLIRARRRTQLAKKSIISAPPSGSASLAATRSFGSSGSRCCENKFGPHADEVSAAWFWSKLRLRGGSRGSRGEEQLAYFRGGFAALTDELVNRMRGRGGEVCLNTPARGLMIDDGRVIGVETDAESVPADAVILTPALPIIAAVAEAACGCRPMPNGSARSTISLMYASFSS